MNDAVKRIIEQRRRALPCGYTENMILLNAFEYACLAVANGADPDSDEFAMYACGKRMILDLMKEVEEDNECENCLGWGTVEAERGMAEPQCPICEGTGLV